MHATQLGARVVLSVHRPIDSAKSKRDAGEWGAEQLDSREHELDVHVNGELGVERRGERAVVSERMRHHPSGPSGAIRDTIRRNQGYSSATISDNQRQSATISDNHLLGVRRDERVRARTACTEAHVLAAHEDIRVAVDELHRLFEAPEAAAHAAGDELRERGRLPHLLHRLHKASEEELDRELEIAGDRDGNGEELS